MRSDRGRRFLRRENRNDLEIDYVAPFGHPFVEKRSVVAVHHLKTALEIGRHPARKVVSTVRSHPPFLLEAAIGRLSVAIAVRLDHHEEHVGLGSARMTTLT